MATHSDDIRESFSRIRRTRANYATGEPVDGERISCGCCRGEEGHRCVCWMHQDAPMGRPAGVCSLHSEHATSHMPLRYTR